MISNRDVVFLGQQLVCKLNQMNHLIALLKILQSFFFSFSGTPVLELTATTGTAKVLCLNLVSTYCFKQ